MAKKSNGTRSELLHCDNCGEEYSSTYKRCPFCGARADRTVFTQSTSRYDLGDRSAPARSSSSRSSAPDDDDYVFDGSGVFDDEGDDDMAYTGRRGGKRLADDDFVLTPTTIAGIIFSIAVVIAAILIVVNVVLPMVRDGQTPTGSNSPGSLPPTSQSPSPAGTTSPDPSDDLQGSASASPSDVVEPSPSPSATVPDNQPTSFTLTYRNRTMAEFTISDQYPDPVQLRADFFPSGTTSEVTWTSSKPEVATVSANGLVTAVKKGNCVITATLANGLTQTCKVDVRITGSGSASSSPSPSSSTSPSSSPSASLTLNRTDITISDQYPEPVQLRASNAEGAVTWTSSKPEVATVSANGAVTRVSKGTCIITATDANGATGTCIVRCG